jgi:hypothetical protein
MALIKCKECNFQVSSQAKLCPYCGGKVKKGISLTFIIILFIIGLNLIVNILKTSAPTDQSSSTPADDVPMDIKRAPKNIEVLQPAKNATKQIESEAQKQFKKWALENTAVTDVAIGGTASIFVTLKPEKYTNRDNVRVIAESLARAYADQTGLKSAVCRIYLGNEVYAVGKHNL